MPEHDYPQRLRYELKGDRLEAEISLIDGSEADPRGATRARNA